MSDVEQRFLLGLGFADTSRPGLIMEKDGTVWLVNPNGTRSQITGADVGATDHGSLTGLADDDHLQYLTAARGDALYLPLDTDVLTQSDLDAFERTAEIQVTDPGGSALTTGDAKAYLFIPQILDGRNLVSAAAAVTTPSTSGTPTVQIRNATQASDMLSTPITIDANEQTSYAASAPPVIDMGNDDVAAGDMIVVDVDVAGTGTKGLFVMLGFA